MRRLQLLALLALLAGLVLPPTVAAQSLHGSLVGQVQDTSGARIPGAGIKLQAVDTSLQRTARSDAQGSFRLDALAPGAYTLSVSMPGFATASSSVTVLLSAAQNLTVTLHPAAASTEVEVRGTASSITTEPIDTTNAVHQGVVTAHDLATIPLAARSFANIASLVPGTEPVEPSDPTKARITAVSTGGSSGLNNALSVDGADNSDDYIGGFLQNLPPDAIQEFSFATAGEDASVGGTTAGAVMITTKRGTSQWHGDAAVYERAAALNARFPIDNPAPNPKQPFSRQNYVATLGGPIAPRKLYVFGSLAYVDENASIAYSPASQTQFSALAQLAKQGLIPGVASIPVPSSVGVPFRDYDGDFRLDWNESGRSQWFWRSSVDSYTTNNALVQQGTLPSTGATTHSNYLNSVISNTFTFSPTWVATLNLSASYLHHTVERNQYLGFALAFPFSSTSSTISGFETFGDNQFVTPITAFPVLRNQEQYQLRYDVAHEAGSHAPRFGFSFIHEPVLSGALSGTAETLTVFALNPSAYRNNTAQFSQDLNCGPAATAGTACTNTPAGDGSFSQNVQRLGLYAEDSWQVTNHLTMNYGLRWDTTFGLFAASGRTQAGNPALETIKALHLGMLPGGGDPLSTAVPHNYRGAWAPRLGLVYAFGKNRNSAFRAGFGLYYNDLAQNGWVNALAAVNTPPAPCATLGDPGCLPGQAAGGVGSIIDPDYHTPYAIHATGGYEHAFNGNWAMSADFTHEEGNHAYRAYTYEPGYSLFSPLFSPDAAAQQANVPALNVYRTDNRSRYDAMMLHLQGNVAQRLDLTVNYTLSRAKTWGCVLGELFDYVNGVCNPLEAFAAGDFGPSGEDVTSRFVVAGGAHAPGGVELTTLFQAGTGRPITLTTPVDVNGTGNTLDDRAVVNGVQTTLDEFRGTPYIQLDLRVSRPWHWNERWTAIPFVEFFNLFNRSNPGSNYVTNIAALPAPVNNLANASAICLNAACTQTQPITSPKQLLVPAGALGDFFGPGTTVGIPFAAQLGLQVTF